jgi:hypothetical protein
MVDLLNVRARQNVPFFDSPPSLVASSLVIPDYCAPSLEEVYADAGYFLPPPFPGGRLLAFFELLRDPAALRALTGEPAA